MADSFRLVQSTSAAIRLEAASAFLAECPPTQPVTIVASGRGAADDFARHVALARGATIGLSRFSLTQLAARVALHALAGRGIAPASQLGAEAVAARAAFDAVSERRLTYLTHVVRTPGFARALARTANDLRLAAVPSPAVADAGPAGADLASLLQRIEQELDAGQIADRARLFAAATAAAPDEPVLAGPLVLLDVAIASPAEAAFVQALIAAARAVLAVCATHDTESCAVLQRAGGRLDVREEGGIRATS